MDTTEDELLRLLIAEQRRLQVYVRSLVGDSHLVEDVLQETAVVVMKRRDTFTPGTSFSAWVREIARRLTLAELRQRGRSEPCISPESAELVVAECGSEETWDEERQAMRTCLDRLPEDSRRALMLRYVDDCSSPQIAEQLGRSIDGAKSLLKRLRVVVAECIAHQLGRTGKEQPA
jgi:RNA polymerase sigma-70 factor (ECF subfamily)